MAALQHYIRREVEARAEGYLLNFRWLAQKNLEYIKKVRLDKPILLKRTGKKSIPIEFRDIEEAMKVLRP